MRLGQRLADGAGVALFRQGVGHVQPHLPQADAGAGIPVVNPQAAPVGPRLAQMRPENGQGAKSGKGGGTALSFDSPT